MLKNILMSLINNLYKSVFVFLSLILIFSCDSKKNQEEIFEYPGEQEELIFPVEIADADTQTYEILLYDSTIDYMLKKKIYPISNTINIFIEEVKLNGFNVRLTRDLFRDSLLYLHEYCTNAELIIKMDNQEKIIANASLTSSNPDYFVIKHPENIGLLKLGKMYLRLHFNRKIKNKRFFKYETSLFVRYSFDGN